MMSLAQKMDSRAGPCCMCSRIVELRGGICAECVETLQDAEHPKLGELRGAIAEDIGQDPTALNSK